MGPLSKILNSLRHWSRCLLLSMQYFNLVPLHISSSKRMYMPERTYTPRRCMLARHACCHHVSVRPSVTGREFYQDGVWEGGFPQVSYVKIDNFRPMSRFPAVY